MKILAWRTKDGHSKTKTPKEQTIRREHKGSALWKRISTIHRKRWLAGGTAALLALCVIAGAVINHVTAVERQLPIYSVETQQKVCSITFDAAWGEDRLR